MDQTGLRTHDFGEHLVNFHPHIEHELHHLSSMHPEERRDLFHLAKIKGIAHYEPRPGIHMVIRHNHDGSYTLDKGRH